MSQSEPQAGQRILVVDDDPGTARLVRSWYRTAPYEIVDASSGEAGLEAAVRCNPDLILLDLRLPGADGIAVARRLKTGAATRAIPVILLTACHDLNSKVEAFAAGADDYVTKPFEFVELDARVRAMLRRRTLFVKLETTIDHLKASNEELEQLLVVDEKTGLYNFRHFQMKLREEWQRAERYGTPLSLVLMDLDNFKMVNDTQGHPAGDRTLREFATLVAGGARATDVASRYGGEEFAIILPHTDARMASRVAERIRAAVEEFVFLADEQPTRITVSGGVATFPTSDVGSMDELIGAADRALYRAKSRGKNRVEIHAAEERGPRSGPSPGTAGRRAPGSGRPDAPAPTES